MSSAVEVWVTLHAKVAVNLLREAAVTRRSLLDFQFACEQLQCLKRAQA
jgi:hypothetical protein